MLTDLREYESAGGGLDLSAALPASERSETLAILTRLDYLFTGRPPDAPALFLAGGVAAGGGSVTGAGGSLVQALSGAAGETAEFYAMRAHRIPSSEGVAAAATEEAAAWHALCELIERDAVMLWWWGAAPAAAMPAVATGAIVADLLGARGSRATILCALPSDFDLPVFLAFSFDAKGKDFCFGAACRPSAEAAARAALIEMAQAEVGLSVARMKAETFGPEKLGRADRLALDHARLIDAAALVDAGLIVPTDAGPLAGDTDPSLADLLARTGARLESLGAQGALQVVQVKSAILQPGRSATVTERLARHAPDPPGLAQLPLY